MQYTLWSRNRLLGETDLGFVFRLDGFRCGWFHPTEIGNRLMPVITGVAPALRARWALGPDATTEADVLSALDQRDALELELRGPDGAPIATEHIDIVDTHYLLELARSAPEPEEVPDEFDLDDESDVQALLEGRQPDDELPELDASWDEEVEHPRYQVQLRLVHHDAIP